MTNANIINNNQNISADTQQALPDLLQGMVDSSLAKLAKIPESGVKTAEISQVASSGELGMKAAREIFRSGNIFEMR